MDIIPSKTSAGEAKMDLRSRLLTYAFVLNDREKFHIEEYYGFLYITTDDTWRDL